MAFEQIGSWQTGLAKLIKVYLLKFTKAILLEDWKLTITSATAATATTKLKKSGKIANFAFINRTH